MSKKQLIDNLRTALEKEFELRQVEALSEADSEAVYVRHDGKEGIELAGHFRPKYDLIVFDPTLGSLGIVRAFADPKTEKAREELEDELESAIEEAAYVRQLLVTDPVINGKGNQPRRFPLTVELVLVAHAAKDTKHHSPPSMLGEMLENLSKGSPALHSIGVHLLERDPCRAAFRRQIRRAFCWLLQATKRWYLSDLSKREADALRPLDQLTLKNFRLPGQRTLELDENAQVHLISGRNGAGKSALTESIELVTTGRIQRLAVADLDSNYLKILRNRRFEGTASVSLRFRDGKRRIFNLYENGVKTPLSAGLSADGFRLNQPLMDGLTTSRPPQRAALFLAAFFSEAEREVLREYQEAHKADESARLGLATLLEDLQGAARVLETYRSFTVGSGDAGQRDFRDSLDEWLEVCALSDLGSKLQIVEDTVARAKESGWDPTGTNMSSSGDSDGAAMQKTLDDLEERRRHLEKALMAAEADQPSPQKRKGAALAPPSEEEIRILDRVGDLVLTRQEAGEGHRLGQALFQAMSASTSVRMGRLSVGGSGWSERLVKRIAGVTKAVEEMQSMGRASDWQGEGPPPPEFERARRAARRLADAEGGISSTFLRRIGMRTPRADYGEFRPSLEKDPDGLLNAALNELVALFTPARWAYEDIAVGISSEGGSEMHIHIEGESSTARADLILNTAELNLFTVALFLLCAVRRDNPLNLLVLDDPLQNMDELTVTMLARGLGKVLRVWAQTRRRWRLLMLFHGGNDLERFRREIPAAIYTLPWLSPHAPTDGKTVIDSDPDQSTPIAAPQELTPLLEYED